MERLVQSNGELRLGAAFPAADEAAWRALVDKVLKGADFERRLVRPTADGIPVRPLYTRGRGRRAARADRAAGPRTLHPRRGAGRRHRAGTSASATPQPDPTTANAQILEDLERGVTSIQLCLSPTGSDRRVCMRHRTHSPARSRACCSTSPRSGSTPARASAKQPQHAARPLPRSAATPAARVRADLNADPLGAAVAGEALDARRRPGAQATDLAAEVAADWPGITTLLADGRPYHAGGASEAQELACAVATGIAYLRALEAAGLAPAAAHARSAWRSPSTPTSSSRSPSCGRCGGFGRGCSRSRALRTAMPGLRLHAETATRMATRRDPPREHPARHRRDLRRRRGRGHQHHRPAVRPRAGPPERPRPADRAQHAARPPGGERARPRHRSRRRELVRREPDRGAGRRRPGRSSRRSSGAGGMLGGPCAPACRRSWSPRAGQALREALATRREP